MEENRKWIEAGKIFEIPLYGSLLCKVKGKEIAIFKTGKEKLYALNNNCPHKNGPLSEGIVHGNSLTCPLHGLVVNMETGETSDPDEAKSSCIPLKIEGETVFISV